MKQTTHNNNNNKTPLRNTLRFSDHWNYSHTLSFPLTTNNNTFLLLCSSPVGLPMHPGMHFVTSYISIYIPPKHSYSHLLLCLNSARSCLLIHTSFHLISAHWNEQIFYSEEIVLRDYPTLLGLFSRDLPKQGPEQALICPSEISDYNSVCLACFSQIFNSTALWFLQPRLPSTFSSSTRSFLFK